MLKKGINMLLFRPILISFCAMIMTLNAHCTVEADSTAWELRRDKNDIRIYTRNLKGLACKELKAEFVVKATMGSLVAFFDDIEFAVNWVYNAKVATKAGNSNLWKGYTYMISAAPWPVSDREVISKYEISQNPITKEVIILLTCASDLLPDKGYVRIKALQGYWKFSPLANGFVKVI